MEYFTSPEAFEYFCGLCISDGHMSQKTRNRGCLSIELKDSDAEILETIREQITVYSNIKTRTRSSNFSDTFTTKTLNVFDLGFRNFMVQQGVPYGIKTGVKIPQWAILNNNFWRGIIDGDGSLGFVNDGRCFLSLVTKSEFLALVPINLIRELCYEFFA